MKTKEQVQKETTIGDVFKTADFTEHIIDGLFIPYDGYGFFHDGEKNTDINVWDATTGEYRWDLAKTNKYPYVIWFNR